MNKKRVKGNFYYWALKNIISRLVAFLWLRQICGQENIPSEGPFIIVPNHQSYLDFMLVIFALRKTKKLIFFIKAPYFDIPLWKFFLIPMGQIRADKTSIRKSIKFLTKDKLPVVLFVEGTRTGDGVVGDAYPGFDKIVRKIPTLKVVPVGIRGAFEVWPRDRKFPKLSGEKIVISIGKPESLIDFDGSKRAFSSMIMGKIKQLII